MRQECEESLRRLGRETIDLYQIHRPDPAHPFEDALAEMQKLREEGKIRWIGVSTFSGEEMARAQRAAPLASAQPLYNLLARSIEADVLPWCRREQVGVLAYSPLARGLLGGRVRADAAFPATDHRGGLAWFQPENRARVAAALERVRPIADAHGISLANLAVAWVLGEPGVTAALVGARTPAQSVENAKAMTVTLATDERQAVADAFRFETP